MPSKVTGRRQLEDRHQGEERRNDSKDEGTGSQILGEQDDRSTPDNLKAEGIVEIEPMEVEDPPGVRNGKETEGSSIDRVRPPRRRFRSFHKRSKISKQMSRDGKTDIRFPIVDL